jgi:quercetin dioxygenase-like cupin family protein
MAPRYRDARPSLPARSLTLPARYYTDAAHFEREMAAIHLFETERFFLDLYCLEPGQSQKVHSHAANDKVDCVVSGEASVTVGAETRSLRAGEAVLARAGEPHGVRNDSPGRAVCLVFMAPRPMKAAEPESGAGR